MTNTASVGDSLSLLLLEINFNYFMGSLVFAGFVAI